MVGLMVRFTCKDETAAADFDDLVARTVERVRANEPGALVYAAHRVEDQPLQRIFYELYRDAATLRNHRSQDYIRGFLDASGQYLSATEIDHLDLVHGKVVGADR